MATSWVTVDPEGKNLQLLSAMPFSVEEGRRVSSVDYVYKGVDPNSTKSFIMNHGSAAGNAIMATNGSGLWYVHVSVIGDLQDVRVLREKMLEKLGVEIVAPKFSLPLPGNIVSSWKRFLWLGKWLVKGHPQSA